MSDEDKESREYKRAMTLGRQEATLETLRADVNHAFGKIRTMEETLSEVRIAIVGFRGTQRIANLIGAAIVVALVGLVVKVLSK